jgi:cobalt-zinc-cadmium efflux system protein
VSHSDSPAHEHDHLHGHAPKSFHRAFAIGVALNLAYVAIEATFGLISHSLALVADAGHNLSDVLGLLLAWGASWLAGRRPTARRSYGYRSSTVLAALINAILLLVAIGAIAWEAITRLPEPGHVAGWTVIWVALIGIGVNLATALLFISGQKEDLNVRGAFLHMAADAAVSAGVVISGIVILLTGWDVLDPLVSLAIVVVIFIGTWGLLRESVDLALDATPAGIDPNAVMAYLAGLPGVKGVHDLHIWAMSTTETALTAHMIYPGPGNIDLMYSTITEKLHEQFDIDHATIQIEHGGNNYTCHLEPADVV